MQCRIATDRISYIMTSFAVLPFKIKTREKLLPAHLSAGQLYCGLTVEESV